MKYSILALVVASTLSHPSRGTEPDWNSYPIPFSCQLSGEVIGNERFKISIEDCSTKHSDLTSRSLNSRVFSQFKISLRGNPEEISSRLNQVLENFIENNELNPSSKQAVNVLSRTPSIQTDQKGNASGVLSGQILNFIGERKPITETDKKVLPIFFNMASYFNGKKAMLTDIGRMIVEQGDRFDAPIYRNTTLHGMRDDQHWPIALGGGHACKALFDLMKNYYDRHGPSGEVIYRTSDYRSKWVNSHFEGQWSHQIEVSHPRLGLEYYGVPDSFIYVFRMIPEGASPADVSNYAIVGYYGILRQSFSTHSVKDTHVTSHFAIDKNFSAALREVFGSTPQQLGDNTIAYEADWTAYSDRFYLKSRKLYEANGVENLRGVRGWVNGAKGLFQGIFD